MDVRIEATAMEAGAEMCHATVVPAPIIPVIEEALSLVASSSCPSIGGTSLSAVSPDNYFNERTALAAA